jgi:hypothetical protein
MRVAATIINGMRAQTVGRVLGIGVRVAGRIAGERLASSAQSGAALKSQPTQNTPVQVSQIAANASRRAVRSSAGIARGVGGFLSPFRRVGRILWLEITGAFFLLPVVAFSPNLWRMRASWSHGPDHRMFVVTACVVLVFLYLGLSSFWRARRR